MKEENAKLRKEIENLSEVKKVYMILYVAVDLQVSGLLSRAIPLPLPQIAQVHVKKRRNINRRLYTYSSCILFRFV
jgi:hypothetical protein